jgi:hypothetical protein
LCYWYKILSYIFSVVVIMWLDRAYHRLFNWKDSKIWNVLWVTDNYSDVLCSYGGQRFTTVTTKSCHCTNTWIRSISLHLHGRVLSASLILQHHFTPWSTRWSILIRLSNQNFELIFPHPIMHASQTLRHIVRVLSQQLNYSIFNSVSFRCSFWQNACSFILLDPKQCNKPPVNVSINIWSELQEWYFPCTQCQGLFSCHKTTDILLICHLNVKNGAVAAIHMLTIYSTPSVTIMLFKLCISFSTSCILFLCSSQSLPMFCIQFNISCHHCDNSLHTFIVGPLCSLSVSFIMCYMCSVSTDI